VPCGGADRARSRLSDLARRQSGPRIQRHIGLRLERFQNARKGRILELFETFDPTWKTSLDDFIDDARASAIGTVVTQRHRIAHGEDSTISYVRISEYREKIEEVVSHIADLTDPAP
jgi:hypothetical protein